jgi:putative ABC transport system permease protein
MSRYVLSDLRWRLRALFRRSVVEAELDAELRSHLENEIGKLIRQGLSPEDAERRATRAFGGFERIKDDTRDARGLAWLDALRQDVRQALRTARKRPGFAIAVVLTLGLGLGANVAMFGIVDRLLLQAPAYLKDPSRVHRIYLAERNNASDVTDALTSYARYQDLARLSPSCSTVAAFKAGELSVGVGDETRLLQVGTVSASYFDLFDARPVIGRFFTARDDAVAVLSWPFWQTRYGGRNVVGEALHIGSVTFTIIGVAPRGFGGVDIGDPVVAFTPV